MFAYARRAFPIFSPEVYLMEPSRHDGGEERFRDIANMQFLQARRRQ